MRGESAEKAADGSTEESGDRDVMVGRPRSVDTRQIAGRLTWGYEHVTGSRNMKVDSFDFGAPYHYPRLGHPPAEEKAPRYTGRTLAVLGIACKVDKGMEPLIDVDTKIKCITYTSYLMITETDLSIE